MLKHIDIVIVNWNAGQQVVDCVESIFEYKNESVNKVVVVDNLSTDNSISKLRALNHKDVVIIENGDNFGFAKGCNIGAENCESDYILFLNPDTVIKKDTFSNVEAFLGNSSKNKNFGVLGAQLLNEYSQVSCTCSRFPEVKHFFSKSLGINRVFKSTYSLNHHMKEFDHLSYKEVDQVMGAFFLVPNELFKVLKGFDERFFVYFEEVDFCYRAKKLGRKIIFEPAIKALHVGCGTTENVKGFRLFLSISSRIKYFKKHSSYWAYIQIILVSFIIEPFARVIKAILGRKFTDVKDILLAYSFFLK
jgi:hypothetical protein